MAYDPYQHAASDPYRFGEGQSQRQQRRRPQRGNGAPAFDIDTDSGDFSSPEVYPYTPHREHAHYPYTISSASPAGPSTLTCPIPGIDAPAAAHQMAGSSTSEFYPTSNYSRARGAQQWIPAQNINIPDAPIASASSSSMTVLLRTSPGSSPATEASPVGTQNAPEETSDAPHTPPGPVTTGPRVREKKHGCWMCHKSFDRPSTLRKHLLVHTGEKAHVCGRCGRRFGVASNLNRHSKKCGMHASNAQSTNVGVDGPGGQTPLTDIAQPVSPLSLPTTITSSSASAQARAVKGKRKRTRTSLSSESSQSQSQDEERVIKPAGPKRRRRAPSPSQWVPPSLIGFDLFPPEFTKATPIPLGPVSPSSSTTSISFDEERNSWDEDVSPTPYHPASWKGRLPGPGFGHGFGVGFGGRDFGGFEGRGSGGFVMGRLVLF
ncbi:hypothetical protein PLICRDRAFT_177868 [Plicaturopsis crispa FD-325 SS-3]|nr:hypothetical protein PLICRDRAFT_177868 [Plicaturopsis crispa FD-325 SS-3]